jgi:hypothetical protein
MKASTSVRCIIALPAEQPDGRALLGRPVLPSDIKRILAKLCWYMAHPVALAGLPSGARATSVGGVAVSGDLSAFTTRDRELAKAIRRWRHPMAKGWGAQVTS